MTRCSAPGCRSGLDIGGIRLCREAEHITADGKRLLIIHGDEFDNVVRYAKFLALLGDWAYTSALVINRWFNMVRRRLGFPYWSLSAWLKRQVKEAVKAIDRFEGGTGRRGAPPRLRRRGLRPHPSRRNARGRRRAVHERRRLGGKLHRPGRASRRPPGTDRLGRAEPPVVLRTAAVTGCATCLISCPFAGDGCAEMLPPAPSHRILIISDAWPPQVNGVVRTLTTVAAELRRMGHVVEVIGPDQFRTLPCPTYPDIALSILPRRKLVRMIEEFQPGRAAYRHRGTAGIAARRWARRTGFRFTTAFHTRFAEYLQARTGIPVRPVYAWMRRFHDAGAGTMVATQSLQDELTSRGFRHIRPWSRGVDLTCSSRDRANSGICRDRSSSMSAGWRSRRTSAPFWIWTCRVPRSWSAAARNSRRCAGNIRTSCSPGRGSVRHWRAPMPAADVFVFPA